MADLEASTTFTESSFETSDYASTMSGPSDEGSIHIGSSFRNWSALRQYVYKVIQSPVFSTTILAVIMLNTLIIALQTSPHVNMYFGYYLSVLDNIFLGIYTFELILKFFALRLKIFKSGWNCFDMFVVAASYADWITFVLSSFNFINTQVFRAVRVFRAFRALRALRSLRAVSFLRSLQIIVSTLIASIPAMLSILGLLYLIMYIYAVIGIELYSSIDPRHFGNIFVAMFSLFQILTLDDWTPDFYDPNIEAAPSIFYYLASFIILQTFIMMNLFVAVIVDNLQNSQAKLEKEDKKDNKAELKAAELNRQKEELENNNSINSPNSLGGNNSPQHHREEPVRDKDYGYYYPGGDRSFADRTLIGYYLMLLAGYESEHNDYDIATSLLTMLHNLSNKEIIDSSM